MVLFLFLLFYLVSQCFLFSRIQGYLRRRLHEQKRQKLIYYLTALFFLLMLYPLAYALAWTIFGIRFYEPFPLAVRGFLAFWVVGSTGLALILLGHDFFYRLKDFLAPRPEPPPDLQRREFLKTGLGALAAAPFSVSGYGVLLGRYRYQIDQIDLPLNGLSSALSQLSIVQLSDIHVGPFMPEEELAAYVEAVNRLEPDIIALTGDFVSSRLEEVAPCVQALSRLKARWGIFACLGNHDVYAGVEDELTRRFKEKDVWVLRNDAVSLRIRNTTINILGIDDLRMGNPDLARSLNIAQKEPGELRLLLSHRPEVFPAAARKGIDLVLSGHYHGGQIKLGVDPESLSVARFITPYAEGLFHLPRRKLSHSGTGAKDAALFVSRGIGTTGLPIRINCPPQIAHLMLKKA